ncbi:MAG: helix-turn-helix domain-containing protein, partial [Spirochaetota bacterium]
SHAEIDLPRYLEQVEATIIADTLALNSGNVSATARALGLSRQGLHNKLARYGIRANERDGGIQVIG